MRRGFSLAAAALVCCAVLRAAAAPGAGAAPEPATPATRAAQESVSPQLLAQAQQALADARRGFVGALSDPVVTGADGRVVWSLEDYRFLDAAPAAPDTVHPALWEHARINNVHGLFEIVPRVYQVRGYDVDNLTIVEGETGLIVVDPMTFAESARVALDLYLRHRPRRPVVAVIYTHSHADHFGGVRGVVDAADVRAGRVEVWAPARFMEEAVGENVLAGPAMARRAQYQFGILQDRGERGHVDAGIGKTVGRGDVTLIAPTRLVEQPHERHVIDGVEFEFALAQDTEAPAEMYFHLPQLRVLDMAELTSQTMHNLLPLRGARVRDSRRWAASIDDALHRYGGSSDVLIAQHNWPVWGGERLRDFLAAQRDLYKYLHDQTVRRMNQGYTPQEIAEMVRLPASLAADWGAQPFYGSVRHNVKAVYQHYLGWYDGHPAHLDPLPPAAAARRTVEYMGGAAAVLERARADFARGDYRWVAQVASQLVFADPGDRAARELAAAAFEQLGYQAQSGTWRAAYLQGAAELRSGAPRAGAVRTMGPDTIRALPLQDFFDLLAVRLDAERAGDRHLVLDWRITDTGERFGLNLGHGALTAREGEVSGGADAIVTTTRSALDRIALRQLSFAQAIGTGEMRVTGPRPGAPGELFELIEAVPATFNVVEP